MADLANKRLVSASETGRRARINIERIKQLTGGDTIVCRLAYSNNVLRFEPRFTILLVTNHKPQIDASDFAAWRRIRLIEFGNRFLANPDPADPLQRKADPHIAEKLRAEAPGILAWIIRGCLEAQATGLEPPAAVQAATKSYRHDEDVVELFIEACCERGPDFRAQSGPLYDAFKAWWIGEYGERSRPPGRKWWAPVMSSKFEKEPGRNVYYKGLRLLEGF
jgi:putative DNA primase/helicase